MNLVVVMGRLTRDIELKDAGQSKVANFSIAVNRAVKREGQPDADFFNCTVFGKRAENLAKYCGQGSKIIVKGSLQNDQYTNQEGQKITRTNIMVNEWEFAESKSSNNGAADADPVDDDNAIPFA